MQIEERIVVNAKPEVIFGIYADVERWNKWDPDTKSSSINGPFVAGTKSRLTPAKGQTVNIELVSVVPNRSFTCDGGVPGFHMRFEHELNPSGVGTEVIHRVTFSGVLAFVIGRIVRAQLRTGLPITLASLKRLAESKP
jgi:Polyketide cyclase / dehydrase and lipid transport